MDHEALMRLVDDGLTFLTACMAAKENNKAWGGPHRLPKDIREAYKTDEKACDYSNDKSPGSDFGSLWEAGVSLRVAATLADGPTFLSDDAAWGVWEEMKILFAAVPNDKGKDICRIAQSQGSGSGSVPVASWPTTALRDTIVARADDVSNLRLRFAKRKRPVTGNTDQTPLAVPEDDKPVPKVAKTDSRLMNSLSTTNQENLPTTSFKKIFCGTSMKSLESQQTELAKTLKKLEHDIHQGSANLRNRRVNEEVTQHVQKGLHQSLREVETALTLGAGGASNQEARYRLEGAALFRDRMSSMIPSASTEEIKKMEDDLGRLCVLQRSILEDMACIKDIMGAKKWYDEAMSKLEKKAETGKWLRFMDGGDALDWLSKAKDG
ncbi:hypothetical protein H9Q74_014022 [Fusarium xylarioides]|nr:hypothetical protein H9Q71_014233 [Fusarium xylarioides]KAG5810335.1 hypothetical protein H9Q74_014022 [Fusarium xylarioides]